MVLKQHQIPKFHTEVLLCAESPVGNFSQPIQADTEKKKKLKIKTKNRFKVRISAFVRKLRVLLKKAQIDTADMKDWSTPRENLKKHLSKRTHGGFQHTQNKFIQLKSTDVQASGKG